MTEKRFEIIKSAIIDGARVIKDNENKYTFATTFETATLINYRKALNELNDENEQLKQAYTQLKHRHSLLHDVCIDAECDRDSYRKDIASLEKENEQLKSEIKDLNDVLARYEEKELKND